MKQRPYKHLLQPGILLLLFVLYTLALTQVDVRPIGPLDSSVGFAQLNARAQAQIGVRLSLYTLTDWLSVVILAIAFGFAILGLWQACKRKSLLRVDADLWALGGFYLLLAAVYVFFELVVINYRPILIGGVLEAAYPSSTTMLVLCIMPTAMLQWQRRIGHKATRRVVLCVSGVFALAMLLGRLLSGVHWASDIAGGILLSAALVSLYWAVLRMLHACSRGKRPL